MCGVGHASSPRIGLVAHLRPVVPSSAERAARSPHSGYGTVRSVCQSVDVPHDLEAVSRHMRCDLRSPSPGAQCSTNMHGHEMDSARSPRRADCNRHTRPCRHPTGAHRVIGGERGACRGARACGVSKTAPNPPPGWLFSMNKSRYVTMSRIPPRQSPKLTGWLIALLVPTLDVLSVRTPQLLHDPPIPAHGVPTPMRGAPTRLSGAPTPPRGPPTPPRSAPTPMRGAPTHLSGVPTPPCGAPTPMRSAPTPLSSAPTAPRGAPTPLRGPPTAPRGAPGVGLTDVPTSEARTSPPLTSLASRRPRRLPRSPRPRAPRPTASPSQTPSARALLSTYLSTSVDANGSQLACHQPGV